MSVTLIDPKKHRQLFLDDYAVEEKIGVKQTVHRPRKCGPIIRPDRSRGQTALQSRSAPQWNSEKGLWEWWYYGEHAYYATSKDGELWERPSLGLYEWNGSKDNNIACDPTKPRIYHIIRDEGDPDMQRRYKALFSSSDRYLGTSPDGFDWTMLDVPPIPSSDESHFTYDDPLSSFGTPLRGRIHTKAIAEVREPLGLFFKKSERQAFVWKFACCLIEKFVLCCACVESLSKEESHEAENLNAPAADDAERPKVAALGVAAHKRQNSIPTRPRRIE